MIIDKIKIGSTVYDVGVKYENVDNTPTNLSDFNNDEGFIDSSALPTKTSELQNDSGFINKDVTNLTNYTPSSETTSQLELILNSTDYKLKGVLKDSTGTVIYTSNEIDLPLESVVVSGTYDSTTKEVVLTLVNSSTVRFSVADLVSGLISSTDLQTVLENYYTKSQIDELLANIDTTADNVYTISVGTNTTDKTVVDKIYELSEKYGKSFIILHEQYGVLIPTITNNTYISCKEIGQPGIMDNNFFVEGTKTIRFRYTNYSWTFYKSTSQISRSSSSTTFSTIARLGDNLSVDRDKLVSVDLSSKQDTMQYSAMPTASADNLGRIVQYTGISDNTYTSGYFYVCTTDGEEEPTYSWTNLQVQESSEGSSKPYIYRGGTATEDIEAFNKLYQKYKTDGYWDLSMIVANYSYDSTTIPLAIVTYDRNYNGLNWYNASFNAYNFNNYNTGSPSKKYMIYFSVGFAVQNNEVVQIKRYFSTGSSSELLFYGSNGISGLPRGYSTDELLSKTNTTSYTPTSDYHPSTKKYVDDSIASAITDALGGNY